MFLAFLPQCVLLNIFLRLYRNCTPTVQRDKNAMCASVFIRVISHDSLVLQKSYGFLIIQMSLNISVHIVTYNIIKVLTVDKTGILIFTLELVYK